MNPGQFIKGSNLLYTLIKAFSFQLEKANTVNDKKE